MTLAQRPTFHTFRDPAGSLGIEENRVLRTVRPEFAVETQAFLDSGVAHEWTEAGRMVSSKVHAIHADGELWNWNMTGYSFPPTLGSGARSNGWRPQC